MAPFLHLSEEELVDNDDFFKTLYAHDIMDKSLTLKLALPLSTDTVRDSMMQEWIMGMDYKEK